MFFFYISSLANTMLITAGEASLRVGDTGHVWLGEEEALLLCHLPSCCPHLCCLVPVCSD